MAPLARRLSSLHAELSQLDAGDVATYIPELGRADPHSFGLAIVTANADSYEAGDSREEFSIQSVSKPFVYAMALMDRGLDAVVDRVGIEPTGDPFNAVTLSEATGRPLNPMVNAGAILTSSLVAGDSVAERRERIVSGLSAFAGRRLSVDPHVMASEFGTSNRNRAISYLMRGSGALELDVEEALEGYIAQCSVLVTALDLATMSATLAAGGRNPITGDQVVPDHLIAPVLSIMATCGMYDGAGAWLYRVGLPAKSGVSGGVITALPNQLGVAAWSPLLDEHGNSVRGVRAMEALSTDLALHVFSPTGPASTPIRRRTNSSVLRSRAGRSVAERARLEELGARIQIVEMGGAIGILAAQAVVDDLLRAEQGGPLGWIVLDARGIGYLHPGALRILNEVLISISERGIVVQVVDRPAHCSGSNEPRWACDARPRLDAVLQGCEDALLASAPEAHEGTDGETALDRCEVLEDLAPEQLAKLQLLMRGLSVPAGAVLADEGEPIKGILWVLRGELNIFAMVNGRQTRLQGVGPGCISGEMSLVDGQDRDRQAVAVDATTIMVLDQSLMASLVLEEPEIAISMLGSLARILVARQRRSQEIVASLTTTSNPDKGTNAIAGNG